MYNSGMVKDIVADVQLVLDCIKQFKTDYNEIKTVMDGIKEKMSYISKYSSAGLAYVSVELMCNYSEFVDAVNFLIMAVSATSELNQWAFTGSFVGKMMHAVGKA